jgi:hypothetical protein
MSTEVEVQKLAGERRDLTGRLYCSDTGEGRKMRKWIEKRLLEIDKKIESMRE